MLQVPTMQSVKKSLQEQQANRKRDFLIQELASIHRAPQSEKGTGSKIGLGAAMLFGATILVTPFKEATPARVILTSVEHHLQCRRSQQSLIHSRVWMKHTLKWILSHLLVVIVTIVMYWRVVRR